MQIRQILTAKLAITMGCVLILSITFLQTGIFAASPIFPTPPAQNDIAGILESDTTLTRALGPWQVTDELVVPGSITLTIEAGTIVYFAEPAELIVQTGGRLIAEGTAEHRILLTRLPDSDLPWGGIQLIATKTDNRLAYIDMQWGDRRSQMILINKATLRIDHMTWTPTHKTVLEVQHPQLIVRHSHFPSATQVEVIHGRWLTDDDYFILDGNTFEKTTGYNDVIDFSDCKRPGPIFQVYNNLFLGGGDDGLDLDGCDAHIEGNVFMQFHKDHTASSTSNAIATGFRYEKTTDIVVVRNLFLDNDHAVLLKEDCYLHAENNTIVNSTLASINFSEWPHRSVAPGKGALLQGNIFWQNTAIFENQFSQPGQPDPQIIANRNLLPAELHYLGNHNYDFEPQFVDPDSNFHLLPTSPARHAGPNGLDLGRYVPAGASISGEPDSVTQANSAKLTIGGPGIFHYRYRVNRLEGRWSEEFSVKEHPILNLANLQPGVSYTVYVQGKNFADVWQTEPPYATSKTWHVVKSTTIDSDESLLPIDFRLFQNYPNPFNATTIIQFALPHAASAQIIIFDQQGREVTELANHHFPAGLSKITWQAEDLASGIFYCRLKFENRQKIMKMVLLQ